MTYNDDPDKWPPCTDCHKKTHPDDMVELRDNEIDLWESLLCVTCASKRLSLLLKELRKNDLQQDCVCEACGKSRYAHAWRAEGSGACFSFRQKELG